MSAVTGPDESSLSSQTRLCCVVRYVKKITGGNCTFQHLLGTLPESRDVKTEADSSYPLE